MPGIADLPNLPGPDDPFWSRVFVRLTAAATGASADSVLDTIATRPEDWRQALRHLGLDAWPLVLGIDGAQFHHWQRIRRDEQRVLTSRASELVDHLTRAGVRAIRLKGHVTRALYPDPSMRPVTDIDLLISPHQLDTAATVLRQNGLSPCSPRPPRFNFEWSFRDGERLLDLHWDLLPRWRIPWDGADCLMGRPDDLRLHAWHALAHFAQHKGFVKPVQEVDLLLFDRAGLLQAVPAPLSGAQRLWRYRKLLFWERRPVRRRGLYRLYNAGAWAPYGRLWRLRHALIGLAVSTRRRGWMAQLIGVRI